jgi:hypothetical protein
VASRILIVGLYNNMGKSVFAVALFHATLNLTYTLFPVYGSHFDMRLGGLVMAFAARCSRQYGDRRHWPDTTMQSGQRDEAA